jgi:hypothetical protein
MLNSFAKSVIKRLHSAFYPLVVIETEMKAEV